MTWQSHYRTGCVHTAYAHVFAFTQGILLDCVASLKPLPICYTVGVHSVVCGSLESHRGASDPKYIEPMYSTSFRGQNNSQRNHIKPRPNVV